MHMHSLTLNSSCESYCLFSSWFSPLCLREIKRNSFSYNKGCQSLRPTPDLGSPLSICSASAQPPDSFTASQKPGVDFLL